MLITSFHDSACISVTHTLVARSIESIVLGIAVLYDYSR